jgi:hypothetical protein
VLLTLLVKQARKKLLSIMSNITTLKNIPRMNEKALDLAAHILNGEANAVKWKIDRHLMPVLFLTGMISSIDETVISNAPFSHC